MGVCVCAFCTLLFERVEECLFALVVVLIYIKIFRVDDVYMCFCSAYTCAYTYVCVCVCSQDIWLYKRPGLYSVDSTSSRAQNCAKERIKTREEIKEKRRGEKPGTQR